jgi:hypothetical protein
VYLDPSFIEVMSGHFKKLDWKGIVKMSINDLLDYKATTGLSEQINFEPVGLVELAL